MCLLIIQIDPKLTRENFEMIWRIPYNIGLASLQNRRSRFILHTCSHSLVFLHRLFPWFENHATDVIAWCLLSQHVSLAISCLGICRIQNSAKYVMISRHLPRYAKGDLPEHWNKPVVPPVRNHQRLQHVSPPWTAIFPSQIRKHHIRLECYANVV